MRIGIPGKDCGACMMCCQVLDIPELNKPPGPDCPNCMKAGGCAIYHSRPKVCRDYECDWLRERDLGPKLKPSLTGVILMTDAESEDYLAVCHPDRPMDWLKNKFVFQHLVFMAKQGHSVMAKAGTKAWIIHESGRWTPTG
jgi:hypothetical protein